jgi:bacillithiol system protein YtxJ
VADRTLARALAERTGVRHQSPQLLYLERGVVRWHLSHGEITTEAVRRRLAGVPDRA